MLLPMGSGGAKQLAISMVIGTTQPTGAAGLIWINTTTAINGWVFSAVEPGSPVEGMIWVQTDAVNANVINILKKNAAIENVKSVRQYVGGAWIRREAYYHNGTSWAQVSYIVINPNTDLAYTGSWSIIDDGDGHWRVKFFTSGTLTVTGTGVIDLFLLGGGGGTPTGVSGGAGGGYTKTIANIALTDGVYNIVIGAGGIALTVNGTGNRGGTTSALGHTADGGYGGVTSGKGGDGGSGGGGAYNSGGSPNTCNGGTNGGNGTNGGDNVSKIGGTGQGTTTREFEETTGTLYSNGGASYGGTIGTLYGTSASVNTGDGAGGSQYNMGYNGGSGIVVLRDAL